MENEISYQGILKNKMIVINIGLEMFADFLQQQGAEVTQVQWNPMEQASKDVKDLLSKLL
ncbi:hypothetical protein [Sedimentibacter sp.]|uniref:hypothetical protein n=1 Tax=Sedimentibacter sp. TaxID=1960295 RepID=UPI000ECBAD39|nr:hypothetical protein [Sedimentibacter sp.]HCX61560.1 hypothetical protein [Clostridiales bacterium]